ncbi:MAG: hypothetical protein ABJB12_09235 [Pseudomonadota bacterium]
MSIPAGCLRGASLTCLLLNALACNNTASTASVEASARGASSAVALSTIDQRAAGWEMGNRYSYRLKLTSALGFGGQGDSFDFDLDAELVAAPTAINAQGTTLFVALVNPKFVSRISGSQEEFDRIAKQLANYGCYFTLAAGQVKDMYFAPGLPAITISVYRQLGAALQFAPSPDHLPRYRVDEYDGTGQYTAEYVRDTQNPAVFSKQKLSYGAILATKGAPPAALKQVLPRVVSASGKVQLTPEGRPLSMRMEEELRIDGAQMPVHAKNRLSLDSDGVTHAAQVRDFLSLPEKLEHLAADEPYAGQANVEALDAARTKGLTYDAIVGKLGTLAKANGGPPLADAQAAAADADKARQEALARENSGLFVALAAVFRQDPKAASEATRRARTDPAVANTLIDALGSSGSESANQALADMLATKGLDPKLRTRVLTALARTPRPSPAAVSALRAELARDPFNTSALYGLGSYARHYRDSGDAAQAKAIGELLIDKLNYTGDLVPRLVVTLGGITNSGYVPALEAVAVHLRDTRGAVRAAAVRSLQSMQDPRVDPLIAATLTSDKDQDVATSAIDAARIRTPSDVLAQALASAAVESTEANVRYRCVELMVRWLDKRPELRSVLQKIAAGDPEERVRALAQGAA